MTPDLMSEYDYSPETLMHYRHRSCPGNTGNNWWIISGGRKDSDLYCPYCGQRLSPIQYEPPPKTAQPPQELDL